MGRRWPIVAFCLAAASVALGDTTEPLGTIVALRVHGANSDERSFRGFVVVGDSVDGYRRYDWGGKSCPQSDISDVEIATIQRGMSDARILIEPHTKPGKDGSRCLVAFSLVLRNDRVALP